MSKKQQALPGEMVDSRRRDFLATTSLWSAATLVLPIGGCGSSIAQGVSDAAYMIDTSIQSPNQDSRVRTLVLHYTAQTLADSIASLTDSQKQVSSTISYLMRPTAVSASVFMRLCRNLVARGMPVSATGRVSGCSMQVRSA